MKRSPFALLTAVLLATVAGSAAQESVDSQGPGGPQPGSAGRPTELRMTRAGSTARDLRGLPFTPPARKWRPERKEPLVERMQLPGGELQLGESAGVGPLAPAPGTIDNFLGLDYANWGAGQPPDPVGDVGPNHYIQAVNTSIGIFRKSDHVRVAAFTFDTFMSQGSFGNLCDTDNFGDPVVLYDSFEDRWVIADFAFQLDNQNNVVNPPGAFQCFAVSKTGDPVLGGWNYYSLHLTDALHDYPKLGVWPDGIYMSANMFGFPASGSFEGTRVWAFNKAQMYAGAADVQVVQFSPPGSEFTLLPANARLQAGTPPPGTPDYFAVVWNYTNAISYYKFHVDWQSISLSTFTGPFHSVAPASWGNPPSTVPTLGGSNNDTLAVRLMMQNQYTNLDGVESLWNTHTVLGGAASTAAPRWYQTVVTGGTVTGTTAQAATHAPDTSVHRYMPSLAVDRAGNMALGYSASSSTLYPAIRYAGRLSSDPASSLSQTEASLVEGTGSQNTSNRWGDYSAMSLDPDGCTFWYTNEYYITTGGNWQTRVGSFRFPSCTQVATGTLQGTVTATAGGAPIAGATVSLGSRTATTDGSGFYSFAALAAGTYPSLGVTAAGYSSASATSVVVTSGGTTTQDFSLGTAPTSACPTDTTQANFQTGVPTNVDLTASPGNVVLSNSANLDQQNTSVTTSGFGFTSTSWFAQSFTAGVTGQLTQVDVDLFCSGCTGTTPNITVSIRATSGDLPTGADLATATIPGFSSGAGGYYSAVFGAPATLAAGTKYAIVVRAVSNPSAGTYAYVISSGSPYAGGRRSTSSNSGSSWSVANPSTDVGFKTYMKTGYAASGDFVSSVKDVNPPAGYYPIWTTISWTATVPASTTLRFQVAGSNSASGPFSFVGPDGTAATYFTTSGASLSQFNGNRYLEYKAYLASIDAASTPTVNDVTVCFVAAASADLVITKTDGVTTVTPGGSVIYTIAVSNPGPSPATGAAMTDNFPPVLTCTWSCAGSGGGTCAASGSGNIADTVNLPAGASVTYTANCAISGSASGTLSNTATVTYAGDLNPGNNSATDTDALAATADLAISKSDGVATATPGGSVTYTIVASNAGPGSAPGATVADSFPAVLSCNWSCAGSGGGTCTASGSGNINDTVSLPSGGSATYTASCTIAAGATGTLSNTATVSHPSDPSTGNNSATDTDTLEASADLSITKTDGVTTATPGGSVTYTIAVSNAGPSHATGASVTDSFPASLSCTWTCSGAGGGTCAAAGAGNINDTVNLPTGSSVTYIAACTISAGATGTLSNTATVSHASDPSTGNNSATDADTLEASADLSITKTDGVTTATPGGSVTYTIAVSNAGPSHATGASVTDSFPASLSCTWTCSGVGGGTCTAAGAGNLSDTVNLPTGSSVTYIAACTISAGATGTLSNTATVTHASDPSPGNNSATDTDTLEASADLSITKTDGVTTATPGGSVTYTIAVSNAGPSHVTGATVADTFPASLSCTWTCSGVGGGTCTAAGAGDISDTVNLPTGSSVTYIAACTIAADATGTLSNTATVSHASDPSMGNNSATDTDTLEASADLSITKTDGVTTATPGGSVTYTITASNAGPSHVIGATVADTFPATLSCTWTCSGAGGGTCTAAGAGNLSDTVNLPTGSSVNYIAACTILAGATGTLSNTATVSNPSDPSTGNNSATDTDTLEASADLSITKTDGVTTVTPGGSVTYTIAVSNAGPSHATGASVTDSFPASLSCTWTCSGAGGGTCTAAGAGDLNDTVNLPSGGSATYTASCTISAGATGTLSNTATVSHASDPSPGDNSATDTDTLVASADLSITKTDGVTTATPGGSVTYTIAVSNAGPSQVTGAAVADTFPATLSCTWTCSGVGGGTCTAAGAGDVNDTVNLPTGSAVTYIAACTISAGATGTLSNTATVSHASDPSTGNNSATDTDTLEASADLSITKTDGATTATPGGSVTYTIAVSNAGPSQVTGASVTDTFPAPLTCTWTCSGAGGGTCAAAGAGDVNDTVNLPVGGSATYTASCTIAADATGTLSNTATVSHPSDPSTGNDSATDTDTLKASADLSITKTNGVTTATPGGSVTYAIAVSNAGPSHVTGASVADTFPATLSCTWTCSGAGGGTCTAAGAGDISDTVNLPTGSSVTYIAACTIAADATGTLSNTATVAHPSDPSLGNNSVTDTDTLEASADLSITKTDGVTTATPGGSFTYTITASNAGPSHVTGASVADTFPATLSCTWTCSGAGGGTCTAAGAGNLSDTVNLPTGSSVTYMAACTIAADATGTLSNTATVSHPSDPSPGNNSATDTDTLEASADLSITKTDGVTTATPGGSVTYTITASNAGPSQVTGATVEDTFPATLSCTWTCSGVGGGTCTAAGAGDLSDTVNLPTGSSVTYMAACTIAADATGTLSNTATVSHPSDPSTGNNSATDTDTLEASADLSITKTDGVTTATPGGSVTYAIAVSNAGPSHVTGATVTDTFQAPLTCTWTCSAAGGGTCTAAGAGNISDTVNLPVGGSATYTASCTIAADATGTLSNTATASHPSDPSAGNNSATDTDALEASADLSITKTDGVTKATPGGAVTYAIAVSNAGPSHVTGATVVDTFQAPLTCTWTCSAAGGGTCTAAGAGNISDTVNLPVGGSATYTASCTIAADATGTLSNTATVSHASDPSPGNNSATDTDTLEASADLSITKTDGVTTATPGGSVTYTIAVSNAGPSQVTGAAVADTFPATLSCTWTCSGVGGGTCTAAGAGDVNDTVNLPTGSAVTYIAACTISAGATGTLSNTATVSHPSDPRTGNNSATDTDTLEASADVSITKTDGSASEVPGTPVTYTIVVANAGPSNASSVTVADTFPAALSNCSTTCAGTGGATCTVGPVSGNLSDTANLPAGGSVTYTATCDLAADATGTLVNTATATVGGGVTDPSTGNNSATDTDTLAASADVSITKTDGVTSVVPGTSVTYTIVATNAGPSDAPSVTVADAFAATLSSCSTTCVGAGGGTCAAGPVVGDLSDTANLPAGGSVTYTATCDLAADATGTLVNTATATVGGGVTDPSTGNNSATDTDTLAASADVSITKSDGVTSVVPGTSVTYTIVATNAGPSDAPSVTVADAFAAALSNCSTTCVGAGGGTCAAGPVVGDLSDTANLPVGSSVTYTATCDLSSSASGTLANTATATVGGGVTDPDAGNNSATDADTLEVSADLAVTKSDGLTAATPGGSATYTIVASNAGPSGASGATVGDTFPATLTCDWSCTGSGGGTCTAAGSGNLSDTVDLPVGGSVTYSASCAIAASATGTLVNTATVSAPAGATDPNGANNSATDTDALDASADVSISKTDGVTGEVPGTPVTYTITVANAGPSDAASVTIADSFPATLSNCSTICVGAGGGSCAAGPLSGNLDDTASLPVGGSVTYTATCDIASSATGDLANTATATVGGGVTDPAPGNNSATDTDSLSPSADLAITKSDGVTTAPPGGPLTYSIAVSNAGPSDAPGTTVTDTFPASLTCSWTCAGSGGGTCTASGAGNLADTAAVPAGGSVTYTAACTVAPGTTGSVRNTATVAAGPGVVDPASGNNSAVDEDVVPGSAVFSDGYETGNLSRWNGAQSALFRIYQVLPVDPALPAVGFDYDFAATAPGEALGAGPILVARDQSGRPVFVILARRGEAAAPLELSLDVEGGAPSGWVAVAGESQPVRVDWSLDTGEHDGHVAVSLGGRLLLWADDGGPSVAPATVELLRVSGAGAR